MVRSVMLTMLVFLAATCISADSAPAAPVSKNNPSRSFNISGVNYGSMKWEREHGSKAYRPLWQPQKRWFGRRRLLRRR